MIKTPIWITNFKNYEEASGAKAVELALVHEKVAKETGKSIAVAVSAFDVYRVSQAVSIPVFAQHIDAIDYGKFTGALLPPLARKSGAIGTLSNHSEKRIPTDELERICACAKKANLIQVLCAENPEEVGKFARLAPEFLAFEPPELIGSTGASVSSAKPDSIHQSVQKAGGIDVLVGAGISSVQDVEVALSLGAKGFLVATAITKSSNPEKALREFVSVF